MIILSKVEATVVNRIATSGLSKTGAVVLARCALLASAPTRWMQMKPNKYCFVRPAGEYLQHAALGVRHRLADDRAFESLKTVCWEKHDTYYQVNQLLCAWAERKGVRR